MKLPKISKKQNRKSLIKKCDELCSKLIRSKGKCERCGKTETLQDAHIFSRRNFSVRYDLENHLCLCYSCHLFWAHKEPILFNDFVENKLGKEKFKKLKMRASIPVYKQDLLLIKLFLEQELKSL